MSLHQPGRHERSKRDIQESTRVVLDTNVLVAASRSRNGASFALLQAVRNRTYIALASVTNRLEGHS